MKNALILHGTNGSSDDNWFPWLKQQLEKDGYLVWCPDLPQADEPNIERYSKFILANKEFQIDGDTVVIGHSSGAVAILGLLAALPSDSTVKASYLVGSFMNDLGWDSLKGLFVSPFDFDLIKQKSRLWYFIHSDNDPYCPLEHAEYLHQQIGGDLLVLPGQKHFSVGTVGDEYREFPYLLHLILGDTVTDEDVRDLCRAMERKKVQLWLDGGWGVDALLGEQTRSHGDIDIVLEKKDVPTLVQYLTELGYGEILRSDTRPHNFMMGNEKAQFVDVHVIEFDSKGNGLYGPSEDAYMFTAEALSGQGSVLGQKVRCISQEWVVKSHRGYKLREKDFHDVLAICEKYSIEVPAEYR